jgi:ribA/ribD-fused uncharacterized protein
MIDSFSGANRYLSNFFPCLVTYEGDHYDSVEHAYQAAKTLRPSERRIVAGADTPGKAKRLGGPKGIVTLREDWEEVKAGIMYDLVEHKFTRHEHLRARLLGTGGQLLVERNNWHDNGWGDCTCPKCAGIEGKNWLGQVLMAVREGLS